MFDVILDTLLDTARLIPFLFVTYLLMEYLEHKAQGKMTELIRKNGGKYRCPLPDYVTPPIGRY